MQTSSSSNALACSQSVGQNSSLAASSSQASTARDRVRGDGMGKEGRTSPHCSVSRSVAPFILPYVDLSMCTLCVTHDYKSYSNGEDYFNLLDSTTGKLIVIRGCKEWFTFPALGKIMTQVLHPQ